MLNQRQRKIFKLTYILMCLCVITIIAGAIASFNSTEYKMGIGPANGDIVKPLDSGWSINGNKCYDHLPQSVYAVDGKVTLTNNIAKETDESYMILFSNNKQKVLVSINGEEVFAIGEKDKLGTSADSQCLIEIPKDLHDIELSVTFFECEGNKCNIPEFKIGTKAQVFVYLAYLDRFALLVVIVSIIMVVMLIAASIYVAIKKISEIKLTCLSVLLGCTTVWYATGLNVSSAFLTRPEFKQYICYMAFMMIPAPAAYFVHFCERQRKSMIMKFMVGIVFLNIILQNILYSLKLASLKNMVYVTFIIIMCVLLTGLYVLFTDYLKKKTVTGLIYLITYLVPTLVSVISMFIYGMNRESAFNHSVKLGTLIFLVLLYFGLLYSLFDNAYKNNAERIHIKTLKEMTVKDPLTDMGNRRAFDEYLNGLGDVTDALLIFMDVNGLKSVNDIYGHETGDELLKRASDVINEAFEDYGETFRLGGDEFAAVIPEPEKSDDDYSSLLMECLIENNKKNTIELSIAYGLSHLLEKDGAKISYSLWKSRADKQMYANKIRMHVDENFYSDNVAENIDELTGILNMAGFKESAMKLILKNTETRYAIWYCDIKKFKFINEFYGYNAGDNLLRYWARTIMNSLGDDEICGRWSSDKMVMLTKYESEGQIFDHFYDLKDRLDEFFENPNERYRVEMATGIFILRDENMESPDINQMIDWAHIAQKTIKDKSGNNVAIFTDQMWTRQKRDILINQTLDAAIENGELFIMLHPQYDYSQKTIIGAEALCRWNHSTLGWLSPVEFVSALERTGQITKLDIFVCNQVCSLLKKWEKMGVKLNISVSVNISRVDISSGNIVEELNKLVSTYNIEPWRLRLEITESAYMEQPEILPQTVNILHQNGFSVEMDDFGSGFSSLNMLKEMDVDVIKMDMRFLSESGSKYKGRQIVSAIIKMAEELNIPVITEGVETEEQAEFLSSVGCNVMQGYFFAKPMMVEEFEELI